MNFTEGRQALMGLFSQLNTLEWDSDNAGDTGSNKKRARSFVVPSDKLLTLINATQQTKNRPKAKQIELLKLRQNEFIGKLRSEISGESNSTVLIPILKAFVDSGHLDQPSTPSLDGTNVSSFVATKLMTCPKHALTLITTDQIPELKVLEATFSRPVLLIQRVSDLGIDGCETRKELANLVMQKWTWLKKKPAFESTSKQSVLDDILNPPIYVQSKLLPGSRHVTSRDCQSALEELGHHPLHLAIASLKANLPKSANYYLNQAKKLTYPTVDDFENASGISLSTFIESEPRHASPQKKMPFFKNRPLPESVGFDTLGLFLKAQPDKRLEYAWYRQKCSDIIDLEELYRDACKVTETGTYNKITFGQMCLAFGFREALNKFVGCCRSNRIYPDGVNPIFDLSSIGPETQYQTSQIYQATGKYSDNILGFQNDVSEHLIEDICATKTITDRESGLKETTLVTTKFKRGSKVSEWIRSQLIPMDYCLVKAALLRYSESDYDTESYELLTKTTLRVKSSDAHTISTLKTFTPISKLRAKSDWITSLNRQAPFLVLKNANTIDFDLSSELLRNGTLDWDELDGSILLDV